MFLNGGGMWGGELHNRLGGAPPVAETRTAPGGGWRAYLSAVG